MRKQSVLVFAGDVFEQVVSVILQLERLRQEGIDEVKADVL